MLNFRTLAAAAALAAIALMVPSTAQAAAGDKPASTDTRVVQHAWSWQG